MILTERPGRSSRSRKDTAELYALTDYHQIILHTVGEGHIDKIRVGLTATMAEMFIDNLRVKTRRVARQGRGRGLRRRAQLWL